MSMDLAAADSSKDGRCDGGSASTDSDAAYVNCLREEKDIAAVSAVVSRWIFGQWPRGSVASRCESAAELAERMTQAATNATAGAADAADGADQSLPLVLVAKDLTGAIVGTVSLKSTSLPAKDEDYAPWLDDFYVTPAHRESGTCATLNANKAHLCTHVLTHPPPRVLVTSSVQVLVFGQCAQGLPIGELFRARIFSCCDVCQL
jgi:hypothetical protein